MDAIRGWIGAPRPGRAVVPYVLPAFTDSRTFRDAFPECVAYGFFPHRHMTLYETAPLLHAKDERIDVRDLGFAATLLPRHRRRSGSWLSAGESCASAAWRCATACSSTGRRTGPRRSAPRDGSIGVASGPQAARCAGASRRPRRARRGPARRGDGGHPARQARAAGGAAAVPGRRAWSAAMAAAAAPARALRRRAGGAGGEAAVGGALARCRRWSRCAAATLAAYHGVEHKAIAAYEHGDEDARDAAKEHDRCGSHLMAPMLAANLAGRGAAARVVERPARWPAARCRWRRSASPSRSSPGASATRDAARRAPCAGRATSSSACWARASPPRTQLEVGRAALDEILRAEGCS